MPTRFLASASRSTLTSDELGADPDDDGGVPPLNDPEDGDDVDTARWRAGASSAWRRRAYQLSEPEGTGFPWVRTR
jgi:hypothetical protein